MTCEQHHEIARVGSYILAAVVLVLVFVVWYLAGRVASMSRLLDAWPALRRPRWPAPPPATFVAECEIKPGQLVVRTDSGGVRPAGEGE